MQLSLVTQMMSRFLKTTSYQFSVLVLRYKPSVSDWACEKKINGGKILYSISKQFNKMTRTLWNCHFFSLLQTPRKRYKMYSHTRTKFIDSPCVLTTQIYLLYKISSFRNTVLCAKLTSQNSQLLGWIKQILSRMENFHGLLSNSSGCLQNLIRPEKPASNLFSARSRHHESNSARSLQKCFSTESLLTSKDAEKGARVFR